MAGASRIIAVDINPDKFPAAIELGATDCVDSSKLDKPVQQHIVEMTTWGGETYENDQCFCTNLYELEYLISFILFIILPDSGLHL